MKTKNVKVKTSDVKDGRTIYSAHPVHGIEKWKVIGKPYVIILGGTEPSLFVKCMTFYGNVSFESTHSLSDMGICTGAGYNDRRSFFKLKQAEAWVAKWKDDKGFISSHKRHVDLCAGFFSDWN